jgi:hypothetical protein
VIVDDNNFVAINVLTEMERASQSLYMKSRLIESNHNNLDVDDNLVDDDSSDDGFTLVRPKRERKAIKRLSLSGKPKNSKKKTKGDPCGFQISPKRKKKIKK